MKYLALIVMLLTLTGCDREVMPSSGENDPATSTAAQPAPVQKSDTLKITYSKADPFEQAQKAKESSPKAHAHNGKPDEKHDASHDAKAKSPTPDNKPEHKEHEHK